MSGVVFQNLDLRQSALLKNVCDTILLILADLDGEDTTRSEKRRRLFGEEAIKIDALLSPVKRQSRFEILDRRIEFVHLRRGDVGGVRDDNIVDRESGIGNR